MRRALVVVALVVALGACGDDGPSLKSGKVTDKDHNAAWTQLIPIFNGKTTTIIPIFHDEEWELTVSNCEFRDKDGSCATAEWNVTPDVFSKTTEGQWVTRP